MIEQNAFSIVFGIFVLLTCRDVFFGTSEQTVEHGVNKHIPIGDHLHHHHSSAALTDAPNMAEGAGVPAIKIQYCHSCGYRQAFEEISKMLRVNFPEIIVDGSPHQPSWLKGQIINLLYFTKIAVVVMIFMEYNPFTYFQMDTPRFWTYMSQNKISAILMILFFANSIESNMMSTGAFEIFYNDMPVWSKIQTGRMPSGPELIQIVQSHVSLGHKIGVGKLMQT